MFVQRALKTIEKMNILLKRTSVVSCARMDLCAAMVNPKQKQIVCRTDMEMYHQWINHQLGHFNIGMPTRKSASFVSI